MDDYEEYLWSFHTIEAYKIPNDHENWATCPKCGKPPRIWSFDNGRFAKCWCSEKYGPAQARAESIMGFCHRTNGCDTTEYDVNGLRKAWAKYAETGKPQNYLPDGTW